MIIVLKPNVQEDEIQHIVQKIEQLGLKAHISRGEQQTIIGAIGDEAVLAEQPLEAISSVERVLPVARPYKLASRDFSPDNTTVRVGSGTIGGGSLTIIAGPSTVESEEQIMEVAHALAKGRADILSGAAYKPRTSPYSFQGLGKKGLDILASARDASGLPVATEVMDPRNISLVAEYADIIQIGSRNMQNYDLLREAGKQPKPILLKRGIMNTLTELLMSAEYILSQGNKNVIICESGIRTFENATPHSLDLMSIPFLRKETHLPVAVDISNAAGQSDYIEPIAMAAVAAGADVVMVEVHPRPEQAMVDGAQSITPDVFTALSDRLRKLHTLIQEMGETV